jgi:hypothetical protein
MESNFILYNFFYSDNLVKVWAFQYLKRLIFGFIGSLILELQRLNWTIMAFQLRFCNRNNVSTQHLERSWGFKLWHLVELQWTTIECLYPELPWEKKGGSNFDTHENLRPIYYKSTLYNVVISFCQKSITIRSSDNEKSEKGGKKWNKKKGNFLEFEASISHYKLLSGKSLRRVFVVVWDSRKKTKKQT